MSVVALTGFFALVITLYHVQFDLAIERWTWMFKYLVIWIGWTTSVTVGYELWRMQ